MKQLPEKPCMISAGSGTDDKDHRASTERLGLWSVLASPMVYEASQHLVGARRWLKRFARETIRPTPGQRVLDIGCGPGALLRFLPSQVHYIGFDRNAAYIERARKSHSGRGDFICDDVTNFLQHGIAPVDI